MIGKIMGKSLKLKELDEEIKHAARVKAMVTKSDMCCFCFSERLGHNRKYQDVKYGTYTFNLGYMNLCICEEHVLELRDSLNDLIAREGLVDKETTK